MDCAGARGLRRFSGSCLSDPDALCAVGLSKCPDPGEKPLNLKKIIDLIAEQAAREASKAPKDPLGGVLLMIARRTIRAIAHCAGF